VNCLMFKNLEEVRNYLGYESFPKGMSQVFDAYVNSNHHIFMDEQEFKEVIERLKMKDVDVEPLIIVLKKIANDPDLSSALAFITYAMVIGAHPSAWLIKKGPRLNHLEFTDQILELLIILSLVKPSILDHQKRQIEIEHAEFNLGHLRNYILNYYNTHHSFGIEPFGWTSYLASLGLIHIDSLNFMHHIFNDPYICLVNRKTSEIFVVVNQVHAINAFGQFSGVNQVGDVAFRTVFESDQDHIFAHPVNSRGIVSNQPIHFNLKEWEIIIKPGDPVIDFHIPTGVPYDIQSIQETFKKGKEFFQKHYPDFEYRAFWCVSWLYSPQLPHIITKTNSNILAVQRQGYICPATPGETSLFDFVFKTPKPDFKSIQPKTSLERDVITFILKGGKVNAGLYLYWFEDIDRFGQTPYLKAFEQELFEAVKPYQEVNA
jgi:hypothetical protein